MKKIFVDTSVLIEFHRRGSGDFVKLLEFARINDVELAISVVVFFEFWSGRSMDNSQITKSAELFFEPFENYLVTPKIAKKAGEIRRHYGTDGMDAIIAATALEHGAQLATLNTKHFENIPRLVLWQER